MSLSDKSIQLYQAISDGEKERVFDHWHASSIGMCPRAHYFKRLHMPEISEKPTGARLIRFQAGHALEAAIRPYIEKVYGAGGSNERMTSEMFGLTGEFDNLILSDNRLVEIKSVHDYAFIDRNGVTSLKEETGNLNKWGKKEYTTKRTPYLAHELQNHAYVLLLKEEKGIEVKEIDYVYMSLSGRLVVYETQVQPELILNVENRLKALNEALASGVPPVCICKPAHKLYDSTMQYCPYKKTPYGTPDEDCCSLKYYKAYQEKK